MPLSVSATHSTVADGTFSASGAVAWDAAHTASLAGIASASQGGTGIAFFQAAGPTVTRTYTFPDANATIARTDAANTFTGVQTFSTPIATGSVATMTATVGGGVPTPPNNTTTFLRGDGTFAAPAGAAALSGITAAAAGNTIASGNNHSQIWNWALTSDSVNAFTFGETTAATGGTSTSGVPNQVIGRFSTLAASTASPLSVYSRAAHVFSISPTTAQILATNGSNSVPTYSFAASTTTGFFSGNANEIALTVNGTQRIRWVGGQSRYAQGSAASPVLTEVADAASSGIFWPSGVSGLAMGVATGGVENSRFQGSEGALFWQASNAGAVTTGYALNFRKSRGTVASPTVITTGDDLATISGFGYVGATGTYVEACQIKFDSTGTIANTTSGVGGIMRLGCAVVGTVGITEVMRLQVATTTGGGWLSMDEADANPATTDLAADDAFAAYRKADKFVIAYNLAGAMNYLSIPLDGATTTWTNSAVAP